MSAEPSSNGRLAIIDGVRTPFMKAATGFKKTEADDLGARVLSEVIARTGIDAGDVDEVLMGCVGQPWTAMNVARVAALRAGVPRDVPALTMHRNCASGMEAITSAHEKSKAGRGTLYLVGGTESMSSAPISFGPEMTGMFEKLSRAKTPGAAAKIWSQFRPRFMKPRLSLVEGLSDKTCGLMMGLTAENVARDFNIRREEQDAYALKSHQKAAEAQKAGRFAQEIIPTPAPPDFKQVCEEDNGIRDGQTMEALAKLRPYFDKRHGSVTVGNACPVTDGAVGLLVTTESRAKAEGLKPLGYLSSYAYAGLDPSRMGLGPVFAMAKLFEQTDWTMNDFGLIELNEAFAAQVIGCQKAAASQTFAEENFGRSEPLGEISDDKLNVNGGAIALGHPVGATGARLVLTLLHEMRRRDVERGLATLCVGGGLGAALVLERGE